MATVAEHKREGIGKYLVVYLCILALAGLQFVIAYQNIHRHRKCSGACCRWP